MFARYEESADGVIARFEDGSSAEGGLLVGADGVNSAVRSQRLPEAEARDTGILAIFGRASITGLELPILGNLLSEGGIMALGPKGSLFFCTAMIFREPPAGAAARLNIDFATYPAEDYAMWAITVRKNATVIQESGPALSKVDGAKLKEIALNEITEFSQDYKLLVEKTDADQTIPVPIRAMPRLKPWRPNRVTLLGDAIHAMPPYGAHGANTALRDAQTLAAGLIAAQNADRIEETIGAYESAMRDYSYPAVRGALRMMKFATAAFPLKRAIFKTFAKIGSAFSRK